MPSLRTLEIATSLWEVNNGFRMSFFLMSELELETENEVADTEPVVP